MFQTLQHPLFLTSVVIAAGNQIMERNGIFLPVVHSYLDDLLCFPVVLTVGLFGYRAVTGDTAYTLGRFQVWSVVALYAFTFEVVLPKRSSVYVADMMDIVAYALGALVFMRWMNRPLQPDP